MLPVQNAFRIYWFLHSVSYTDKTLAAEEVVMGPPAVTRLKSFAVLDAFVDVYEGPGRLAVTLNVGKWPLRRPMRNSASWVLLANRFQKLDSQASVVGFS